VSTNVLIQECKINGNWHQVARKTYILEGSRVRYERIFCLKLGIHLCWLQRWGEEAEEEKEKTSLT
jgi:hypothetical protein